MKAKNIGIFLAVLWSILPAMAWCAGPQASTDIAELSQWLAQRQQAGGDPSDATLEVIAEQKAKREALQNEEKACALSIATDQPASVDSLIQRLRQHLPAH